MRRIIVLNTKGGCGKTTIATNLASLYANQGLNTVLLDHDPLGCSKGWLDARPAECRPIHGIAAYAKTKSTMTRSWQMRIPAEAERVIIDTPAGLDKPDLLERLRGVDFALVPIVPSAIDMRAAVPFLTELQSLNRSCRAKIGLVANRVQDSSRNLQILERFAELSSLPVVMHVRANLLYMQAADQGLGAHELDDPAAEAEREAWQCLFDWLEKESTPASRFASA